MDKKREKKAAAWMALKAGWPCLAMAFALLQPAHAATVDTLAAIRASGTIVLAYRAGALPFSYLDKNRRPVGYAVDLCLNIVEAVKRELKAPNLNVAFKPVDSVTRFTSLVEGKAHLECGVTTNNAERRQRVAFTIPHFFSSVRAIVRSNDGIRNWPDLRGRTVITTRNTTSIKLLNDRSDVRALNLRLIEGKDDEDSFAHVAQGKADVYPMDDVLLYALRAKSPDPSKFTIIGDPLSVEPYAIMLPKDDPAFKRIADAEMVRMIDAGEIHRLYDKWFMRPIEADGTVINMRMPMGYLLRDSLRFPSDKVGDQ